MDDRPGKKDSKVSSKPDKNLDEIEKFVRQKELQNEILKKIIEGFNQASDKGK